MLRSGFRALAKPIQANVNNIPLAVDPKEFKTGSLGWYTNCKQNIDVGGNFVACQVAVQITIIGSKEMTD